jgi:hypothetical protein
MLERQQTLPRAFGIGADAPILSSHACQNMEPATVATVFIDWSIGTLALPVRLKVGRQFLCDRPQPLVALKSGREAQLPLGTEPQNAAKPSLPPSLLVIPSLLRKCQRK